MHPGTRKKSWPVILAVVLTGCTEAAPPTTTLSFQDVTAAVGVGFVHAHAATGDYHYPETFGAGVAWLDVDADGRLDLYFVDGGQLPGTGMLADSPTPASNRLYRNTASSAGVSFEDVTTQWSAGGNGYGMGVSAADADGDGLVDLYVTNVGPNELMLQRAGHFQQTGMAADPRWGTGCAFADLDLDGDLDLAVVNYVEFRVQDVRSCQRGSIRTYCDPDVYEPEGDILYRNTLQESGRFDLVEITQAAGFDQIARSLGISVTDLDLDGDSEIYVANDGQQNLLYRNDSRPDHITLTEVGLASGVRFNADGMAEAGMGVGAQDLNADGWPDLLIANFSRETHTLYRHSGKGLQFRDVTRDAGLARSSFLPLGFGVSLFDADLDGDIDLFSAHGHVLDKAEQIDASLTYAQPDGLYLNESGRFVDHSPALGAAYAEPRPSRSSATADYDNDGDLDIVVTSVGSSPRILRNDQSSDRHWITIQLQARHPGNRAGWGSRLEIDVDGVSLMRQLQTGGSYLSSPPPRLHIGLGSGPAQVGATVHWPGGAVEEWSLLKVDQLHLLVQGTGASLAE